MSISTSNNAITLGRGSYSGTSITGLGQALVNLSGVTNNADQTSTNTSAATSTVNGVAASTVQAGAAAGASANQDSTASIRSGTTKANVGLSNVANESRSTILAGNLTGTVNSVAVSTVTSGAAAGASANQDSTASIRGGVTVATVISGGNSHSWTKSGSNYAPSGTRQTTEIEWRSGTGALLTTATIPVSYTHLTLPTKRIV